MVELLNLPADGFRKNCVHRYFSIGLSEKPGLNRSKGVGCCPTPPPPALISLNWGLSHSAHENSKMIFAVLGVVVFTHKFHLAFVRRRKTNPRKKKESDNKIFNFFNVGPNAFFLQICKGKKYMHIFSRKKAVQQHWWFAGLYNGEIVSPFRFLLTIPKRVSTSCFWKGISEQ